MKFIQLLLSIATIIMGVYYIWFNGDVVFKLIPMVLIILYALINLFNKTDRKPYHILTIIGLLFCISGDYLITKSFVTGLFAFLCGHIFYILSFRKQMITAKLNKFVIFITIYALVMMAIMSIALINKDNYALIAPVILYTAIIALMAYTAWRTRNTWLIVGSLLFLISDSILAWNKFVSSVPASGVLIMVTYYAANYLIASSFKQKIN